MYISRPLSCLTWNNSLFQRTNISVYLHQNKGNILHLLFHKSMILSIFEIADFLTLKMGHVKSRDCSNTVDTWKAVIVRIR